MVDKVIEDCQENANEEAKKTALDIIYEMIEEVATEQDCLAACEDRLLDVIFDDILEEAEAWHLENVQSIISEVIENLVTESVTEGENEMDMKQYANQVTMDLVTKSTLNLDSLVQEDENVTARAAIEEEPVSTRPGTGSSMYKVWQ